ncbi:MAG: carboxypeptidase-like regulatory domain-containing protein [Acidobacteriales bacterium]|nr:carboxypeptidase-like regulatory domain-containing protein [Terriglobales bacterium]
MQFGYRQFIKTFLAVSLVFFVAGSLYAQKTTATLSGNITDSSGASVVGAKVVVRNVDTNVTRDSVSNEQGHYTADFLNPGKYDVTFEAQGFKRKVVQGVVAEVNQTIELNAVMEVGDVQQQISVQASIPVMQVTESSLGGVIENEQVRDMPLNGRQFLSLALLVPGAVPAIGGRQASERGTISSAININGNREGSNLFLIDGTLNTDPNFNTFVISPNIDSIQEFKVQTNTYSAEFGAQAGGQINLVTVSGTNRYHGTAYEFLRNSSLDAKNLFDRPAPYKIPPYRQNQFGATFGGPVRKDKTFFFLSYEGYRRVQAQTSTAIVPSATVRTGDFSQVTKIWDPSTTRPNPAFSPSLPASSTNPQYLRDPFPGSVIPSTRLSPIAQGILKYVDMPNVGMVSSWTGRYLNNDPNRQNMDQFSVRFDHTLSAKDQIFGRYSYSEESVFSPGALSTQGTRREPRPQVFTLGETRFFSPNVANDVRIGYTRFRLNAVNKNAYTKNIPGELGIQGEEGLPPSAWEVPSVGISGLSGIGGATFGVPTETRDNTYQIQDTVTVNRGSHNLRMGVQIYRFQLNNATLNYILPTFNVYSTPYTADVTNPTGAGAGSQFADFLLGISHNNQVTSGSGQVYLRRTMFAPWFDDSWRVTRNLTINLGLRWDLMTPFVEKFDHMGGMYIPNINGTPMPIPLQAGKTVAGYGDVSRSIINTDYTNFAPRFGFAYKVKGSERTVIRASYGMFYDTQIGNTVVDLVRNPPYQVRILVNVPDAIYPYLSLSQLRPNDPSITSSYFGQGQVANGKMVWPTAYAQQWNFSLQQEVMANWAVTASYVGSTTRHLSYSAPMNTAYPGYGPVNPRRPHYPTVSNIYQVALPRANAYYNALQVKSEQRAFHSLTSLISYTWSKSMDTAQEIRAGGSTQDPNLWEYDKWNRSLSNYDMRHRLTGSVIYELPFGKGKRFVNGGGISNAVLGGWQVNTILTFQTGQPNTVWSGVDTANIAGGASRPDRVAGSALYPDNQTADNWFNKGAFAAAPDCRNQVVCNSLSSPLLTYGNSGRNILTNPGRRNMDLSMFKSFRFGEFRTIQFRAESFNLSNTPPLGWPSTTLTDGNAGRILGAGASRQVQFALKYMF